MVALTKIMELSAFCTLVASGSAASAKDVASPFLPAGETADAPFGFVEMCTRDPQLCRLGGPDATANAPAPIAPKAAAPDPISDIAGATSQLTGQRAPCAVAPSNKARNPGRADFNDGLSFATTYANMMLNGGWAYPVLSLVQLGTQSGDAASCAAPLATSLLKNPPPSRLGQQAGRRPSRRLDRLARAALKRDRAHLRAINSEVNRTVIQVADIDSTGISEQWQRTGASKTPVGDCEDIAIEKRIRLMEHGFATQRLFYAVSYVQGYGLHTVLVARLESDDYILDSLSPHVMKWSQVHYQWLRQQSPGQPMVWSRVGGAVRTAASAAANTTAVTAS